MDKLIIALIETSIGLLLFYFVFAVWLKKETFFRENRFYLLITAVFSLLIPWINFSLPNNNTNTVILYNLLDVVSVTANGYEQSLVQQITAWQWIFIVYALGVVFMLGLFIVKLVKITRISKISDKTFGEFLPENVKFIQADVAPFSFLNRIYINPDNYSQHQVNEIIAHERVHVTQQHTYDCLFYEFLIVFFWFNPIVYKYRTSAKELHEYLADEGAIKSGVSEEVYQQLLFEQAPGVSMLTLANSFNYSLLKRRLIMLTKIKSSKWAKIRVLFVLPVILALLVVFACQQTNPDIVENSIINDSKSAMMDGNNSTNAVYKESDGQVQNIEDANGYKVDEKVYFLVEVMPEFPGGDLELRKFIAKNIEYPAKAKETGTEGKIFVQFNVNELGEIEQVKHVATRAPIKEKNAIDEIAVVGYTEVFHKEGKAFDELVAEAIRVVSTQPNWKPGVQDGKNVKVQFTIPINFQLN
jgi:beta-lactamase regulating signal transducer with metallopeptidase domain